MDITVTGRRINVTDALRDYAEEKIGNSMKAMDISPLSAEVVLQVEKNPANPTPCTCEVTMHAKGHIIRVEENEESLFAAIDVAAAKVLRQLRKYKTRVLNKRTAAAEPVKQGGDVDYDALMQELSEEDEIVRVKEIELLPLTEEEALVAIDLLGHDFYAYIDRDTNATHIIYRRENGGYGLLKSQA
jgi:putative sigma-54 modulation protein